MIVANDAGKPDPWRVRSWPTAAEQGNMVLLPGGADALPTVDATSFPILILARCRRSAPLHMHSVYAKEVRRAVCQ